MRTLTPHVKSSGAALAVVLVMLVCAAPFANAERDENRVQRAANQGKKDSVQPEDTSSFTVPSQKTAPAYTPPPRSISDILRRLGPEKAIPEDCAVRHRQREIEQAKKRQWLKRYYEGTEKYSGGFDLSSTERMDAVARGRLAMRFSEQELNEGNVRGSIDWLEIGLAGTPFSQGNFRALLAMRYSLAGDLNSARRELKRAKSLAAQVKSSSWSKKRKGWVSVVDAYVELATAKVAESKGSYSAAEEHYRQTIAHIGVSSVAPGSFGYDDRLLYADLGRVMMRQGRLAEAEARVRKEVRGARPPIKARLSLLLAEILYEQARYEDAVVLARRGINFYAAGCLPPTSFQLALARRMLARSLLAQGKWQGALAEYEAIHTGMAVKEPELFERKFAGDVDWGRSLLKAGRADEAVSVMARGYERDRGRLGGDHERTVTALGFLAAAHAAQGNHLQALEEFSRAVPILVEWWREGTSAVSGARAQRLREILTAYIELLDVLRNTPLEARVKGDIPSEMFRLSDVIRGSTVQRALAANVARAAAKSPKLAELVRRQQDAQNHIEALESVLVTAVSQPGEEQSPEVIRELQQRVAKSRETQAVLLGEVERRFPKYAALINPKAPTIEAARERLHPGETLVVIRVGEEKTYVWAVPKSGGVAFASRALGLDEVEQMVHHLRTSLDPDVETLGEVPAFDTDIAYRLYAELLVPVQRGWQKAKTLLIVADGALGQLPLSVLPTEPMRVKPDTSLFSEYREVPWLARKHAVVSLPSVASLISLRAVERKGAGGGAAFVGFGDPWFSEGQAAEARAAATTELASLDTRGLKLRRRFSPKTRDVDSAELASLPRLPETATELRDMAVAVGADPVSDVFVGARASESQVKGMNLAQRRVVVFATHGLVAGDLDGLTQPALALSSPKVTGGGEDGLLTMGELLGLKLNADWVVLSACNTAAAEGAGAEAVSGLGRAFFYAGARSLLVTHWPVETTSAKALTTEIFRQQSQDALLTRGEALRRAMMKLVDGPGYVDPATGQSLFSYAHPLFWAPFALVGDG